MSVTTGMCPNYNSPEWQVLEEAVGRFEAVKDWIKHDGAVRTPEQVKLDLPVESPVSEEKIAFSRESVTEINKKLEEFLTQFGFSTEQLGDLKEVTGYSIIGATDFLEKTIFVKKDRIEDAYTKEAAYSIFGLLGKKNLLRKDLIASIHLIEDYDKLKEKYSTSNLSEYKINELIAAEYLQSKLIEAHKEALKTDNTAVSVDVTAKNKLEYLILRIKQWWADIVRAFFKTYKRGIVENAFNQIANDVINNNTRLFNVATKKDYSKIELTAEQKEINDAIVKIGAINSGSYALNRQGTLTRESVGDLDYFLPFEVKDTFIKDLKKKYPNVVFTDPFSGVMGNRSLTLSAKIGDVKIDFFLPTSKEESDKNKIILIDGVKYHHWKNIFDAKVRIGSKKHMSDLAGFVPFNRENIIYNKEISNKKQKLSLQITDIKERIEDIKAKYGWGTSGYNRKYDLESRLTDLEEEYNNVKENTEQDSKLGIVGQRHYNFDFIQSKRNNTYDSDTSTVEPDEITSFIDGPTADTALAYFKNNNIDFKSSPLYKDLLSYFSNNYKKAAVALYLTYSENFKKFYGNTRKGAHSTFYIDYDSFYVQPKTDRYSKSSVLVDEQGAPVIFYHGAGTKFDKFSKDYFLSGEGAMAYGAGFYSTNYKPTADNYRDTAKAAKKLFDKLIKEQNQELLTLVSNLKIDITEESLTSLLMGSMGLEDNTNKDKVALLNLLGLTETKALYISMTNPIYWDKSMSSENINLIQEEFGITLKNKEGGSIYRELERTLKITDKEISARLYQIGIDGVIRNAYGGTTAGGFSHKQGEKHVIFFEPVQSKSVTNSGLFSLNNDNIYDPIEIKDSNVTNQETIAFARETKFTTIDSKANLIHKLRKGGILSKKSFGTKGGSILVSIPKIETVKDLARGTKQGVIPLPRTKDVKKWDILENLVLEFDLTWMELTESADAYYVAIPSDVYERSFDKDVQDSTSFFRETPFFFDPSVSTEPIEVDAKAMEKAFAEGAMAQMVQAYSESTGMPYRLVTPAEAGVLTNNRWNGEKGFYLGDTVCLVKGLFTKNTIFHEFSHPVVRAIRYQSKTLFDNLYTKALASPEAQTIKQTVKDLYATPGTDNYLYSENSDDFKEEVIVRAMEAHFKNQQNKTKESEGFIKFIKDLLYAIKQQMRKIFGQKITVDRLKIDTSIEELAEMLSKGDKFDLKIQHVSQSDVEAYVREQQTELADIQKVDKKDLAVLTEKIYNTVLNHLKKLQQNPNYKEIAEIFANEAETTELSRMKSGMGPFKQKLDDKLDRLIKDVTYSKNLGEATVNSLYHLQTLSEKISKHLEALSDNPNDKDGLQQMSYYQGLIDDWRNVTKDIKSALKGKVPASNKLHTLINEIETHLNHSSDHIHSIRKTLLVPVITTQLTQMGEFIDQHHKDGYLTKEEYDNIKITPERIKLMLEGKIYENNFFNSFLEGYMYNQDPLIASAAKYMNDQYTDVITNTQRDLNTFAADIKKDLADIGYTGRNPEELGRKVTYLDEIGYTDVDGTFVTKKIRTFLSKVGNWRAPKAKTDFDIAELRKKPRTEENRKAIRAAEYKKDKHNAVFFNQPMHVEFYENLELFADEIGQEAREEYDQVRHDAEAFRDSMLSGMTEEELKAGNESIRIKYQNLYSLKTPTGEMKNERDQEKALRLQQFRDHNKKFYERKTYIKSFRTAYENYKQYLTDNNYSKDAAAGQLSPYDKALEKWINDNTVKKLKPEYKDQVAEIQKKLAKISEGIGRSHTYFSDMYENTFKFRDEDFQIDGNRILEKDEALAAQIIEWETLMDQEKNGNLYNSLSGIEKIEFFGLLDDLRGLKQKAPTQAYLDTFNAFLEHMDLEVFNKAIGSNAVTSENIDLVVKDQETTSGEVKKGVGKGGITLLNSLFKQNPAFEEWFKRSHRKVNKLDKEGNVLGFSWERSYIWNTTEPVDKDNYESTALEVDENGKALPGKTIPRAPGFRYTYSSVRPTFVDKTGKTVPTQTKKVVGETVDNKGQWLPKSIEQGAPDNTYINQAYYDLQKNDPKAFQILEKTSKFHLQNQKGLGNQAKLYLDLPRFEQNTLETLRSGNALSKFGKRFKMFFAKSKDDAVRGFNWSEVDFNIAKSDAFDDELSASKVPIFGTALIDDNIASADIFSTTTRYMLSAAMHRKKVEMLPTFNALKSVLSDPDNAIKEITGYTEANELNRGILNYRNKKGKNVRLEAITALMDRELGGQNLVGPGKDTKWLNQTMGFLMSRASFGFFALNAPSAIKNSLSAHMQIMIEAAAGWYLTPSTYGKGIVWAGDLMAQISGQTYEVGPKTLKVQLTEIFDPTRGRQEEKFGDSISRSLLKDVVDGSWLYNFRKWTEMHATMSLFGGMMYKQKVNRTVNGKTETIDYADAWELDSAGQIKLKEGVDPEYGIDGKKFKEFREKVNTVSKRLQGAYARFDQPEANRYLLFRMVWFLRKFFMPMLMDRWAFRGSILDPKLRYDIGTGEMTQGYYITFTKLLLRTAMSVKYGLPKMNAMQKRSVIKMTTEVLSLYALSLLWSALFDYNPDDEDRFEKIKKRSGAMPIPGIIEEDPEYPFHLDGWLANHTLNTMIQVKAENDQWLPVPGLGLDNYMNTLNLKSFAYGPTIEVYVKAITDIQQMMSDDQRAYYKQDVGPYNWQKEDSAKLWNHIGKMWGLAGTTFDPALMTKYTEWMQQPARR